MAHEVSVHYTEAIVQRAARQFLMRFIRRDVLIGVAAVLFAVVIWLGFGLDWQYAALLAGLGIALVAMVVFVGFVYVRASVGKFRAMRDPTVQWRFGDESFATVSDIGSAELKWLAVIEVWQFPDVWLLFFGKRGWGYLTLPTANLSLEQKEYIL
jgi:hypothetical protein